MSKGIEHFLAGRFFAAHEEWEVEWRRAVEPERSYLQALIQVCGVALHLEGSRPDPARRLALRALELIAEAQAHEALQGRQGVRIEIEGLEDGLLEVAAHLSAGDRGIEELLKRIRRLQPSLRPAGTN